MDTVCKPRQRGAPIVTGTIDGFIRGFAPIPANAPHWFSNPIHIIWSDGVGGIINIHSNQNRNVREKDKY